MNESRDPVIRRVHLQVIDVSENSCTMLYQVAESFRSGWQFNRIFLEGVLERVLERKLE